MGRLIGRQVERYVVLVARKVHWKGCVLKGVSEGDMEGKAHGAS